MTEITEMTPRCSVSHSVPYQHHPLTNYPLLKSWKAFVRMGGVADKLLCNVILFNLRMATNIIAALNLVRGPPSIIIVIPKNIL